MAWEKIPEGLSRDKWLGKKFLMVCPETNGSGKPTEAFIVYYMVS
jgi:hypothetical protein